VPSGLSSAGKSDKTLTFDASSGELSLSPITLTSGYVTHLLDVLDTDRVDSAFTGDVLLGATLSVSPFKFQYQYDEGGIPKFYFENPGGVLTIAHGSNILLTASVDSGMVFDPTQEVPFFAPLTDIHLNTAAESNFIAQIESRIVDPNELSFDLFINPDSTFFPETSNFEFSTATSTVAGIAQNGIPAIPEPTNFAMLIAGLGLLGLRLRREMLA
jgi:hypothetical protein